MAVVGTNLESPEGVNLGAPSSCRFTFRLSGAFSLGDIIFIQTRAVHLAASDPARSWQQGT